MEEEETEEPLQIYIGEEDLSLVDTDDNNNDTVPRKQQDGNNNNAPAFRDEKDGKKSEEESPADSPRHKKDNRLPKKGRKACHSQADLTEALQKLAGTPSPAPMAPRAGESARVVQLLDEPVRLPFASRERPKPPLAHRLGPVHPAPFDNKQEYDLEFPHPGYYTAQGWEDPTSVFS